MGGAKAALAHVHCPQIPHWVCSLFLSCAVLPSRIRAQLGPRPKGRSSRTSSSVFSPDGRPGSAQVPRAPLYCLPQREEGTKEQG